MSPGHAALEAHCPVRVRGADASCTSAKTRVVVLGSGWGAISFIKNLDPAAFGEDGPYELVLVSPRNYMVYTPLLPSAMGGVVSETSIVESVRNLMSGKGTYYEARTTDIDPASRTLTCVKEFCEVCAARKGPSEHTEADHTFTLQYDILLCSVGAVNATFGIQGVQQHCWFLKSMEDAKKLRRHASKSLEHAALPHVSPEERRRLLSFVVVGGGPTGVEVAAELRDLVEEDVTRQMPHIKVGAGSPGAAAALPQAAAALVTEVHEGEVEVEHKDGAKERVPFGTCIWATGIAMHPLVAALKAKLPPELQDSRRGLVVDSHLRVLGTQGTIFCLGDAAVTAASPQAALPPTAQVARQEGEYLARLLSGAKLGLVPEAEAEAAGGGGELVPLPEAAKPFRYMHLGSLAYLWGQKGVMDLPFKLPFLKTLRGYLGGHTWRGLETWMQVSNRTRWLVAHDWFRTAVFGRNTSDV
ncbi:hypothetical protein CHLNCDRAFT_143930 [Chlorella variabilis]|uniref:NADH:ubiquinone reductase (non-electrogenic) n=1 Tax=Chlorella variabilis TaxID=554065 RepID=E1ZAS0_CHLVA|nr:hypothetical protein CHLNCDRAFT_143930 [Chlorella variabilis]EFN57108.1 hypothetical protein CHLNCDRAFT_143930 [Chlorella variabilis]|eukprot:XP_005849210.1 hypothetical protein CHLNCDRAFT_143930 [Chlorella variabilis]